MEIFLNIKHESKVISFVQPASVASHRHRYATSKRSWTLFKTLAGIFSVGLFPQMMYGNSLSNTTGKHIKSRSKEELTSQTMARWFQPLTKILVKMGIFPKYRSENIFKDK